MNTSTFSTVPPQRLPRPSETLRGFLYTGLQAVRGRPLGRFIRQIADRERLPRAEFDALHRQQLEAMLQYSAAHVPLYGTDRWTAALAQGSANIERWPVLENSELRARYDEMRAIPRPRRVDTLRTSGTTGAAPLRVDMTADAATWGWAHRYRGMLWHGIPVGAITLRVTHDRRPLRDRILGQKCVWDLHAPGIVDEALDFLQRARPTMVAGTPSALFYLARCLVERGVKAPLAPYARVGGEHLFGFQRRQIEATLGARAIDSYGTTETGAVAGECPAGSMHIYTDHLHLEIFDGDVPAAPGEMGDIVITTLRDTAMPLVRYRVGDRGRLATSPCECGLPRPVLTDLEARSDDAFPTPDGERVHGSILIEKLSQVFSSPAAHGIRQIKFQQRDPRHWEAWIERPGAGDLPDPVETIVTRIVHETYGADCEVAVHTVEVLPRRHGKFRYYRTGRSA